MTDDLMLTNEVALLTRKPAGTLRYYRSLGIGPASFKLGRRIVYRRTVVLAWLDAQEQADPRTTTSCPEAQL